MADNRRVLLVDDDPEVIETYREILMSPPRRSRRRRTSTAPTFELTCVSSGEQALEVVQRELAEGRRFACGVFDMRMPGIDGVETIRAIRKLDRGLLCAVCTAYSDRTIDEIDRLFWPSEKDQWDYLQKPVSPTELTQKIRCLVSSWNRRRREEKRQVRMATLISQLSRLASVRPGDVDSSLDMLITAVRDLTQASRGALLEDGPTGKRIVRSWSDDEDPGWPNTLAEMEPGQPDSDSSNLVFFAVPGERVHRTLALDSNEEADRELLGSVGLLLDNAARLITLNSQLNAKNDALAAHCEALARAREQAIQSAKLAAIGQVAAGVAHEVNSPLSVIQLETELVVEVLEAERIDPSAIEMSALQIQQEVKRIKRVVSQVRDFARKSPDAREAVDVTSVVDAALVILKHRLANEPVQLNVDIPDDLPPVKGDTTQITQILVNLIGNALDAIYGSGRSALVVRAESPPGRPNIVRIDVSDQGRGMSESVADLALRPFFTTKAPGQGTGLGLAIVQTIVDLHGGLLDIDSEAGVGTTVRVELPIFLAPRTEGDPSRPPRVLVLRGSDDQAIATAEAVRQAGANPSVISSYDEASDRIARGEADLLVADIKIEDTTVWTLLDEIDENEHPAAPVLVIGRGRHTGQTNELGQLGISGEVAEPIDVPALRKLIFDTLGLSSRSVSPSGPQKIASPR